MGFQQASWWFPHRLRGQHGPGQSGEEEMTKVAHAHGGFQAYGDNKHVKLMEKLRYKLASQFEKIWKVLGKVIWPSQWITLLGDFTRDFTVPYILLLSTLL